jgi:hypothetical protein
MYITPGGLNQPTGDPPNHDATVVLARSPRRPPPIVKPTRRRISRRLVGPLSSLVLCPSGGGGSHSRTRVNGAAPSRPTAPVCSLGTHAWPTTVLDDPFRRPASLRPTSAMATKRSPRSAAAGASPRDRNRPESARVDPCRRALIAAVNAEPCLVLSI